MTQSEVRQEALKMALLESISPELLTREVWESLHPAVVAETNSMKFNGEWAIIIDKMSIENID